MKKRIAIGLIGLTTLSLGAAGVMAFPGHGIFQDDSLASAIQMGDYDAFITTLSSIDPNAATHMTEDRFQDIVERQEVHDAVEDAIEAGDYDAWVAAVSATPQGDELINLITEDDFQKLIELHEAREEVENLTEELGLPRGPGMMPAMERMEGPRLHDGGVMQDEAVSAAIEAGDYDAFIAALSETEMGQRMADAMTEEHFNQLVENRQNGGSWRR